MKSDILNKIHKIMYMYYILHAWYEDVLATIFFHD